MKFVWLSGCEARLSTLTNNYMNGSRIDHTPNWVAHRAVVLLDTFRTVGY